VQDWDCDVGGGEPVNETLPPPELFPLKVKLDVLPPDELDTLLVDPLTAANAEPPLAVALPKTDDEDDWAKALPPRRRTNAPKKRIRFMDRSPNYCW